MKKYVFLFTILISIVLLSCDEGLTNIVDVVEQYIKKNKLPITIGEEIIVKNDFNITDKTSFQLFFLDLSNTLANNISEGYFNEKTIENYIELEKIITGFYNSCISNNYEFALIFSNERNENKLLVDYLEYYDYNITLNNNFVILDNNTNYTKLENLIEILLQMSDITRNNIINYFLHDWNNEKTYIYRKMVFVNGIIETIDNEDIVLALETGIMTFSYYMIDAIIYLFKIKGYDIKKYENILEELKNKKIEFQKIVDDYNRGNQ